MTKKPMSPKYSLTKRNLESIFKSALICMLSVGFVMLLRALVPEYNWAPTITAIATATSAWLVNLVKEYLEEK